MSGKLSKEEKEKWKRVITNYLNDSKDELHLTNFDMRHIQYCFKLLKEAVRDHEDQKQKLTSTTESNNTLIEQYKRKIEEKEEEISALKSLLYLDGRVEESNTNVVKIKTNSSIELEKENVPPSTDSLELSPAQRVAFQIFLQDPKNRPELDFYKNSIEEIYEIAKNLTVVIEQCQNNILHIRSKHITCTDRVSAAEVDLELLNQQSIYRNSLTKLQQLKKETEHFKKGMEQAKLNVLENFKLWYESLSREEYDNKYENRAEKSHLDPSKSASYRSSEIVNDFRTIWKQGGDNQHQEVVETPRLRCRNRSVTPCSREDTPVEGPIISENSIQSRNDNKYATRKESMSHTRYRPKSPLKFASNLWKTKSNYSNRFDSFSCDGNIDTIDGFTEENINHILTTPNVRAFTPNSCFNSKEDRRRSRSKSPKSRFDYKYQWVQEYNNPFNSKVEDRSRSRSPQKFCAFDSFFSYDERGSSRQRKKRNNGSSFSVVYQDIMGSNDYLNDDNVKYLVPERPYSSNSSDIGYKGDEEQFGMRGCINKYWNSRYDSKFKIKDEFGSCRDVASRILEETSAVKSDWDYKGLDAHKESNFGLKTSLHSSKAGFEIPNLTNNVECSKFGYVSGDVNNEESKLNIKDLKISSPKSNFNTAVVKCDSMFLPDDSQEFKSFVKTIPLTGDVEVDEEIIKFYRTKFVCTNNS